MNICRIFKLAKNCLHRYRNYRNIYVNIRFYSCFNSKLATNKKQVKFQKMLPMAGASNEKHFNEQKKRRSKSYLRMAATDNENMESMQIFFHQYLAFCMGIRKVADVCTKFHLMRLELDSRQIDNIILEREWGELPRSALKSLTRFIIWATFDKIGMELFHRQYIVIAVGLHLVMFSHYI